jgi:hypothetical protein
MQLEKQKVHVRPALASILPVASPSGHVKNVLEQEWTFNQGTHTVMSV